MGVQIYAALLSFLGGYRLKPQEFALFDKIALVQDEETSLGFHELLVE